jgi:hypothetical protein
MARPLRIEFPGAIYADFHEVINNKRIYSIFKLPNFAAKTTEILEV